MGADPCGYISNPGEKDRHVTCVDAAIADGALILHVKPVSKSFDMMLRYIDAAYLNLRISFLRLALLLKVFGVGRQVSDGAECRLSEHRLSVADGYVLCGFPFRTNDVMLLLRTRLLLTSCIFGIRSLLS